MLASEAVPGLRVAAEPPLRKTGIRVLGDLPWGAHICLFYETEEDLLDSCLSYFRAGLQSNEFCVWAVSHPITAADATAALQRDSSAVRRHLQQGRIEILNGDDWYLPDDRFDLQRITAGWVNKLAYALSKGCEGLRISGNAFWIGSKYWRDFCKYEHEVDGVLADRRMIALCTYPLQESRAVDILDVTRAHHCSIARRHGEWEFLETPELGRARREIDRPGDALGILSRSFPGHRSLTPRERAVLAQIVRGASSKEAARTLGIAPRTVEFHRANIMKKLDARNTVDLVRGILGG